MYRPTIASLFVLLLAASGCKKAEPTAPEPSKTAAEAPAQKPDEAAKAPAAGDNATGKEAVVTTGDAETSGEALDREAIVKYVDRQKGMILICYKRALQRLPGLRGRVVTNFTISPTGKVLRPQVAKSTLSNQEVEQCIAERMLRWRFQPPTNGEAITVTYPFTFETR